jgi:signal transduction histidine kinase
VVAAALLAGAVYLWHRNGMDRQLALERVRSRIATDLHDDIGASLARIAVMSEAVKDRVNAGDGDSQRMLANIAETSRSLVEGMGDIVWSIDPRHDNVCDVVARLRAFGSDVLETRGIRWTCEEDSSALKEELSPDQRRQLYLIFKEAIHNIARHSQAKSVVLRIQVRDNHLWGEIRDDGRGIRTDRQTGLGIGSMQARAAQLGGVFQIVASGEGGTQVILHFPLSAQKA